MSTEHQKYSTDNQALAIARYAEARGYEIVRTYADEGKSGLNIDGRPALQSLLIDIEAGTADFEAVLVYDVSRWGRFQDPDEAASYELRCRRAGIAVHYCAEQFEIDGSIGSSIIKTVKRAMAGEYSRELSIKVSAGQSHLIRLGYRQGGAAGYGLRRLLVDQHGNRKGELSRGGFVRVDPETDLLHINEEFTASLVIARCFSTGAGSLRWKLRLNTPAPPDLTVAIPMDSENEHPLDYYLLPRMCLAGALLRLCEHNGLSLDAFRFPSLDRFYRMAARYPFRSAA